VNGHVTTFGTTGYTYEETFVLYDRLTRSLWYPSRWDSFAATSGRLRGQAIPILEHPSIMSLADWTSQHPDTLVLLGDKSTVDPAGSAHREEAGADEKE